MLLLFVFFGGKLHEVGLARVGDPQLHVKLYMYCVYVPNVC